MVSLCLRNRPSQCWLALQLEEHWIELWQNGNKIMSVKLIARGTMNRKSNGNKAEQCLQNSSVWRTIIRNQNRTRRILSAPTFCGKFEAVEFDDLRFSLTSTSSWCWENPARKKLNQCRKKKSTANDNDNGRRVYWSVQGFYFLFFGKNFGSYGLGIRGFVIRGASISLVCWSDEVGFRIKDWKRFRPNLENISAWTAAVLGRVACFCNLFESMITQHFKNASIFWETQYLVMVIRCMQNFIIMVLKQRWHYFPSTYIPTKFLALF